MDQAYTPRAASSGSNAGGGGGSQQQPLVPAYAFGFRCSSNGGDNTTRDNVVHNLSDAKRNALFFVSGHFGVIYDVESGTQQLLLGHSNAISCCCVSADRQFIVTADEGPNDPLLIVWNASSATPVRTLSPPSGVTAMDLSFDSSLLAVLTDSHELSLWQWAAPADTPIAVAPIPLADPQTCVRFNPSDPSELVSNGRERVVFWHAFPELVACVPPLASKDFRHPVGSFTQSTFLLGQSTAASATMDGDIVVWDIPPFVSGIPWGVKAVKALQLHHGPIRVLTSTPDHVATGGDEGFVRFFDHQFRIVAWFEDLAAGPIASLSFARVPPDPYDPSEFKDADFIIATRMGSIIHIQPSSWEDSDVANRRGRLVLQFHDGGVFGVATHPSKPLFATAGHTGLVQIWNYESRIILSSRRFDKLMAHRLAFDPDGQFIAIGFTNGTVRVVYAYDLSDVPQSTHRQSRDCISEIVFSGDGQFLATSDTDRCVVLYKYEPGTTQAEQGSWIYVGKYRAHTKPITGIIFGSSADTTPRLLSISEDRTLVEFDLPLSSVATGLVLKNIIKIEQVAVPTAMAWHPRLGKEDFIIVASDQYKFKLYNSNTKACRKTILGPTYGGPLNRLVNVPCSGGPAAPRYLAYATHSKVLGLIKLPLDGNPHRAMGLIAHPGEVAWLCVSHDARYLFSAGGADGSVYMWQLDFAALDRLATAGGDGVAPFVAMLEGGDQGAVYKELQEYFYYAQLKSQGEDTMRPRHIGATVPLAQVPHVLRGLGYYPTEREIEDLVNELKFTNFIDTGEQIEAVTLDTIIRVYANHKPVFGLSERHLEDAFRVLGADEDGALNLDYLLLQLQYKGEAMNETEIRECLQALLGEDAQRRLSQMKELTARDFAEQVLGFEPLPNTQQDSPPES